MTTPDDGIESSLLTAEVIVCCGSGGVGKTTTAATIALHLARRGRRAVVVTIDPAKRLADALGLDGGLTNEPARIDLPAEGRSGEGSNGGELWATMLDTAQTFDGLVRTNAKNDEQADRILANPFYRNIAGALSGTQEYMAAERLHALHGDDRFDVVVVDTPPTRNALDFLEAPGTLAKFLDHPLFKLLMMPTRRGLKVLNVAAQPVLRTIGKVVGGEVLADAISFFQAFEGMESGFRTRADEVMALLRRASTRYVLVAAPRSDTIEEARYFASKLREASLHVGVLIVNRATPAFPRPSGKRPTSGPSLALWTNLDQLHAAAASERTQLAPLVDDVGAAPVCWVPMLPNDVHDLDGLDQIRSLLFGAGGTAG